MNALTQMRILFPTIVWLYVCCQSTLVWAIQLPAIDQQPTQQQTAVSQDQTTDPDPTSPNESSSHSQEARYVPSLDGSNLFQMNSERRVHLILGAAVSGGFDSNPQNRGRSVGSIVSSYTPYLGLQTSTPKMQYLLQYHPTISRYSSYSNEMLHVTSMAFSSRISQRLDWMFTLNSSHGNDSVRLLSPSQSTAVGGVATTGSDSGSYLPNAGLFTSIQADLDFRYDATARDFLTYHVSNGYMSYPELHNIGRVATGETFYEHSLKPSVGVVGYITLSRFYGDLKCTTVGGGSGIRWQPKERLLLSLRGGPQLNTPSCRAQESFSYSGSITTKMLNRSQFFLTADRIPVAGNLGAGLWQDDITGGYERRIHANNAFTVDAGYVHDSTLVNRSTYQGSFFDATFQRIIRKELTLACNYRAFSGNSNQVGISRQMFFVSLSFTPNNGIPSQ